ncbi:MAG TPA: creatininase family protein [Candidatus Nitrosopolaris sp.]|nr:creatininase family protein [Candidatus Nitrosopolaris sp.]
MSVPIYNISDYEFRKGLKKTRRAIIPVGSLEQHGAHLPVSTDSLISERIATRVADALKCFVLPVISYGVSFEHLPMFNVSLRNFTLSDMLCEVCVSLSSQGITEIIFINGHHGNVGVLQYLSQNLDAKIRTKSRIFAINYWNGMQKKLDHAGEVETSLVLAISPGLVRMDRAEPNLRRLAKSRIAYSTITTTPGSFPKVTGNGVWGEPRNASKELGDRLLNEIVGNLLHIISELPQE